MSEPKLPPSPGLRAVSEQSNKQMKPAAEPEDEILRARLPGGRTVRILFRGPPPESKDIDRVIALLKLAKDSYEG